MYQVNHVDNDVEIVKSVSILGCKVLALIDKRTDINNFWHSIWLKLNDVSRVVSELIGPASANIFID